MELAVVASCFVLRAVAGGVVAGVPLSNWFLVFTSFAALFIVTGKRSAEHARLGDERGVHRLVSTNTASLPEVDPDDLGSRHPRVVLPLGVRADGGSRHAGKNVVWIELTVIPLVLSVLHILRLLDAARAVSPNNLPSVTGCFRATACSG